MTNIPTLIENESAEPMYPRGTGAKPIVIMGDNSAVAPTPNTILKFYDYASAAVSVASGGVGIQPTDWSFPLTTAMRAENPLLAAIADVFIEGSIYDTSLDNLGVEYVYAINVRTVVSPGALTAQMWTDAMTLSESLPENEMLELYALCSDVSVMNSVKTHTAAQRLKGMKRTAFFTAADRTTAKATVILMTDSAQGTYIQNSTVGIHRDPSMQAKFVAKCACTEYFMDPGYKPYRSATPTEIMTIGRTDADDYTGAGIIVDGLSINPDFTGRVEPVMAVSTAYRITPTRPVDAYLHHRFNMDHQSVVTNNIALSMIKKNNTETARAMAEASMRGYLAGEVTAGNLQAKTTTADGRPADDGFMISIKLDTIDAFKIVKSMKARPIGSVHMIVDNEIIQAPVAGGA